MFNGGIKKKMSLIDKLLKKKIDVCSKDCCECEQSTPITQRIYYCEKYDQFVNNNGTKYFLVEKSETK